VEPTLLNVFGSAGYFTALGCSSCLLGHTASALFLWHTELCQQHLCKRFRAAAGKDGPSALSVRLSSWCCQGLGKAVLPIAVLVAGLGGRTTSGGGPGYSQGSRVISGQRSSMRSKALPVVSALKMLEKCCCGKAVVVQAGSL